MQEKVENNSVLTIKIVPRVLARKYTFYIGVLIQYLVACYVCLINC